MSRFAMSRFVMSRLRSLMILVLALPLAACAIKPMTDAERAHQLVQGASLVLKNFKASRDDPMDQFRALLPKAQGILIMPGVVKGGFVLAAEGGSGVMLAKDASGNWSYPAFYLLAAGSVGFQAGAQVGDAIMLIFNQDAVASVIKNQGKLGADMGLIIGTIGGGVEASTTTNMGADVMVFTQGIGAFAGGSLEASALIKRNDLNAAYYGKTVSPEDIILRAQGQNPAADPLREQLAAN